MQNAFHHLPQSLITWAAIPASDLEVQTDAVDGGHPQHYGQYQGDKIEAILVTIRTHVYNRCRVVKSEKSC